MSPRTPTLSSRASARLLAALLAAGLPAAVHAQQAAGPQKELSEKVSEAMGKIQEFTTKKDWPQAMALLDSLLAGAKPESFDRLVVQQVRAQVFLQKGDNLKAIEPLEEAVTLGDRYKFLEPKALLEYSDYLAQLYYMAASEAKSPELQRPLFQKSSGYIERWIKETPKPNPEKLSFAASILFYWANLDAEKKDINLIKRAEKHIDEALLLATRPKEALYVLKLATLQEQDKVAEAAEYLELLVEQFPSNKQYWGQLAASYLNLKDDVRTILTIERAQALGHMNTTKDNFNLVGIYFNINQYDRAIALLEKGLQTGAIEPEKKNWELLAASYQQLKREDKAIDTYKAAAKLFPNDGNLLMQAGQIYYGNDKTEDAYKTIKLATERSELGNRGRALTFLAYLCFELKKFDEALAAANKALEQPDADKDATLRLRKAIEDNIKEREAFLNSKI